MEKSKTKLDKSVNANAGRKVLADIGNVKHNFLKTEERKGCRPGKGKIETMLFRASRKDAVDLGNMDTNSSDKHSRAFGSHLFVISFAVGARIGLSLFGGYCACHIRFLNWT